LSGPPEIAELHNLIGGLRLCVASLKSRYGDVPAMRRVVNDADRLLNDLERLDIDAAELDLGRATPHQHAGEKIPVPDTQYDTAFWRDVDDEGVGGQSGVR
jgi:hypothetical protein